MDLKRDVKHLRVFNERGGEGEAKMDIDIEQFTRQSLHHKEVSVLRAIEQRPLFRLAVKATNFFPSCT